MTEKTTDDDRRVLVFKLTDDEWSYLVEQGRRIRAERNVVYPPGIWSEEDHVRYAVQRAVTNTYTDREAK